MRTLHAANDRKMPSPSPDSPKAKQDKAKAIKEREAALDDALEDTFPASDPIAFTPKPPAKPKN